MTVTDTTRQLAEARARIRDLEAQITARSNLRTPAQADAAGLHLDNDLCTGYLQDPHDLGIAVAMFKKHIALCGVGTAGSRERENLCLTIREQTGSHLDVDQFIEGLFKASGIRDLQDSEKATSRKWPERSLVRLCIHQFIKTGLYAVFPVANVEALQRLLDENALDLEKRPTHTANIACLVAFTAQVTEMHRLKPGFAGCDPDAYLRAALSLLPRMLMEGASLRTLESFAIFVSWNDVTLKLTDCY